MLAAFGSATVMFYLSAPCWGASLGWEGDTESLFLAGMLMISSSAVISKVAARDPHQSRALGSACDGRPW